MGLAEGVQVVSFLILSAMVLGGAIGVVLLRNMVHSAFLLGFVFVGVAGLYILLNADFVAAAQVLIYVGAVNVLILFAIMLVNKRPPPVKSGISARNTITGIVCIGLFVLLGTSIYQVPWNIQAPIPMNTVIEIGKRLFGEFLLPFEIASVLLLLAMIGAIILAQREFIPDRAAGGPEPLALPERPREAEDEAITTVTR